MAQEGGADALSALHRRRAMGKLSVPRGFGKLAVFQTAMRNRVELILKDLAGGDDGTRTRDLMRDRHAF